MPEPANVTIVRRRVAPAQPHRAQRRDDQTETEQHEDVRRSDEEPCEVPGQKVPQAREQRLHFVLQRQRQDHEAQDHQRREREDHKQDQTLRIHDSLV